jgi:hypothetical protein
MVEYEITEELAEEVARRYNEHSKTIEVIDVFKDDGVWEVKVSAPLYVETDLLGPDIPKNSHTERVSVASLLENSVYEESITQEVYSDDFPKYLK